MLVGMQTDASTLENSMEALQKVKNRTPQSSNTTTKYLPKEYKNSNSKGCMHLYSFCSIIYNSQDTEDTQVSISWWMDKDVVYTHIHTHTQWDII